MHCTLATQGWLESENRKQRLFPRTFKMATAKSTKTRVLFGNLVEQMEAYQRKALGIKPTLGPVPSDAGVNGHAGTGFNTDEQPSQVKAAQVVVEVKPEPEVGMWEWMFGPSKPAPAVQSSR